MSSENRENTVMSPDSGYESQFEEKELQKFEEKELRKLVKSKGEIIRDRLLEEADAEQRKRYISGWKRCEDYARDVICIHCLTYDIYHMGLLDLFKEEKKMFPKEVWFYFDGTSENEVEKSLLKCVSAIEWE